MLKELTVEDIFIECCKHFEVKATYKKYLNLSKRVYKIKTVGTYKRIPMKIEYLKLTETLNLLGVDSMNREKIYESYRVVILENNTQFRLERIKSEN